MFAGKTWHRCLLSKQGTCILYFLLCSHGPEEGRFYILAAFSHLWPVEDALHFLPHPKKAAQCKAKLLEPLVPSHLESGSLPLWSGRPMSNRCGGSRGEALREPLPVNLKPRLTSDLKRLQQTNDLRPPETSDAPSAAKIFILDVQLPEP